LERLQFHQRNDVSIIMNSKRSTRKTEPTPPVEVKGEQPKLFPIVGIGASAGGLEAFTQLLSHLPVDTGMAFVLIQHMSPDRESLLSEILARSTKMPVIEVEAGMAVEPNRVYVIPPNASMTIEHGLLLLTPRDRSKRGLMSVDTFLLSLATERGDRAIAVVLSGGDGDGARGLEAIKAAGGTTFAQSEDTAKVNSMPNTAVATGQVDFILPPDLIAAKIAELSGHPYIAAEVSPLELGLEPQLADSEISSEDEIATIFGLLRAQTGVDFTNYKQTTLNRRIQRRMMLSKSAQIGDYAVYLHQNPLEVMALYQDLLINVTSFFRDPDSFELLKREVFPVITMAKFPGVPVRIWIAGCSTGEEAYSIAICLLEFLTRRMLHIPIQIYATDVSEAAIDYARSGFYTPSQVVNVSQDRLNQFFIPVEGGYQISKSVRELCVFARQNLISDPPFSRMDLITCRNVLIYLGSSLQKQLLPMFHYGLNSTGFLMLSGSETVGDFLDLFNLIDKRNKVYTKRVVAGKQWIGDKSSNRAFANTEPQILAPKKINDLKIQKEADRIVLSQYAPVGVTIDANLEIVQFRGQTSAYLEPSPGKASFNLLKMAKPELRLELQSTIRRAKQQEQSIESKGLKLTEGNNNRYINIHVTPFQTSSSEEFFLVLFEETSVGTNLLSIDSATNSPSEHEELESRQEIARLKQELKNTTDRLQSIVEEQHATNQDLRAANEEILSSNEELQSMNEELETAKEEIQSTNEELSTIGDELNRRNQELNHIVSDLQNLLSSTNIPILILDNDLRIRRFTPAIELIFHLIGTDVGRPLGDIVHNLAIADLEQQILAVIRTLNLTTQEVQDRDGHWYELRIRPYQTIDRKIDGAVLVLMDINDLKRGSQKLIAARDYAEAIVEAVVEPLIVLNLDLQAITANHAFYKTFQVPQIKTEQHSIFELGNGQWNIPQLRSLLLEILSNNATFKDFEVEHEFEQIGHKVMLLNARKMESIDDVQTILLAIEDITEQKRLEREYSRLLVESQSARMTAESANRAKDDFLSTLSHELRNPLTAMIGWAHLLRMNKLDKTKIARGLETIERCAQAQSQLIEDILDISRITTGRLTLDTSLIQLIPVINAAIEIINLAATARNITLESKLDRSTYKILGDPIRLQQVMWNLLANAIKFTPIGGQIKIELTYIDKQAKITVADTGKGINSDFLPYIFDRFSQEDGSHSRSNSGLGIGLSIVRHLVELHGGTVGVESLGEDKGSTFTVKLPLRVKPDPTPQVEPVYLTINPLVPKNPDIPSLAGVRVLVVDDAADIRELSIGLLETYGVTVTAVGSAKEALATIVANPHGYDVLLSDIGMPEQDGYALIRQIRALNADAGGKIPAAAITAYAGDWDRQESIDAGFQLHLAKPVESNRLAWAVATLSGRM
jgi:two-component system, chemotaxis family, CheB/CheR fusion protein